ncbi:MAG TPA: transposase [Polyangiaceae bacterium]
MCQVVIEEGSNVFRSRCVHPYFRSFEEVQQVTLAPFSLQRAILCVRMLAAAIGYYQRHEAALFRFIDDTCVPIDTSPTERVFQNVAKLRLDMPCTGSTEGAHRACVLLGIVASSRAQRRSRSAG